MAKKLLENLAYASLKDSAFTSVFDSYDSFGLSPYEELLIDLVSSREALLSLVAMF